MQTYDGAAVMSGQLSGLQTQIRQDYPFAFFFHCAAHRFNLVLCQSAQILSRLSQQQGFHEIARRMRTTSAFRAFASTVEKFYIALEIR